MPHQRKTEEEGENAVGTVHKIISVTIRVIVMLRRPGSGEGGNCCINLHRLSLELAEHQCLGEESC